MAKKPDERKAMLEKMSEDQIKAVATPRGGLFGVLEHIPHAHPLRGR